MFYDNLTQKFIQGYWNLTQKFITASKIDRNIYLEAGTYSFFLIKFGEEREEERLQKIYFVAFSLSFSSDTHTDAVSHISIQNNCFTLICFF